MAEANRAWMRVQWRSHKVLWNASGGRLGRRVAGLPVLELVTTGRRSGTPRQILITYIDLDGAPTVVGTNAGRDADPAWVSNLRANPLAKARWDGTWREVRGVELEGDARGRAWAAALAANPGYEAYLEGMTRDVPIIRLEEI
jgi:deazaflavin-dependent oxidoreductase (nitroreductase family)